MKWWSDGYCGQILNFALIFAKVMDFWLMHLFVHELSLGSSIQQNDFLVLGTLKAASLQTEAATTTST